MNVPSVSRFTPATRRIRVSFEFFPPKTEEMEKTLWESIDAAGAACAEFRLGDLWRRRLDPRAHPFDRQADPGGDRADAGRASDLRCRDRAEIDAVIRRLSRGRRAPHRGAARRSGRRRRREIRAASRAATRTRADLVAGIKRIADIEVSVSAYPEKHPDSPTVEADIDMLKAKVDAGATRAMTQFFFENDRYFRLSRPGARARHRYADRARHPAGAELQADEEFRRALRRLGAGWLAERFDGLDDDVATRKLIAAAVAAEQVLDLVDRGVTDFHFYTMNRADLVYAVCHLLGLRPGG